MNFFMVNRTTIQALLSGGEIPVGKCENLTLKGDFTLAQLLQDLPVELILYCPACGERHIDPPHKTPHRTHACQKCGTLWAVSVVPTVGVQFLPGCKDKVIP